MVNRISFLTNFFGEPSNSTIELPNVLENNPSHEGWFIGLLLIIGLLLFAIARAFDSGYLKKIIANYFSLSDSVSVQKNEIKIVSLPSLLLILNYFLGLWICCMFFVKTLFDSSEYLYLITGIVAIVLVIYQIIGVVITMWITGETITLKEQLIQTLTGFQFSGMLLTLLGLVWFFNPQFNNELFYIFSGIYLGLIFIRILKGIMLSLFQGIVWYYIILYFCTLEILPILVTYYYVDLNFKL